MDRVEIDFIGVVIKLTFLGLDGLVPFHQDHSLPDKTDFQFILNVQNATDRVLGIHLNGLLAR